MTSTARVLKLLTVLTLTAFAGQGRAASTPQTLSLGGQLFTAAGQPIVSANVNFRIQIYDASETCVLYSEEHLGEDLSASSGHFDLILGTGTSKVNNVGAAGALDGKIFLNAGTTAVANCASSPLNLAAGQDRQIHVLYDLGAGYVTMTPAVPVVSAASALVADTLNGLSATDFIQVNGTSALTQANEEYAFSLTNWPRLKALLDGTSSQYLPSSPTVPLDVNGQRITDLHDPTAAQDAATKHYVDTNLGGSALDLTAVGPMTGAGSTLLWDATANKWVAGTASTSPTGAAGGDLSGTYPNPTIANDKITSAKIKSTGVAVNRLVITDATTGANLTYGECASAGQVFAWTATGWACATVSSLAPVTSVAGKTGAVTLNAADVSGLGTAALFNWGTAANQIVRLDGSAALPAVDGSQLTNVNAVQLQGRGIAATAPTAGQVLGWNGAAWTPVAVGGGSVTSVGGGAGLVGGTITASGTLSVDVGTSAGKIMQLNASAQVPAVDGSLLTQINAVKLQSRVVAATAPAAGQVLGWNATSSQWEPTLAASGSVTGIATANGILGGPITTNGTLSIDTGTAANKILQLNASAQIPAVDGSLLTQINAVSLQTRAVAATAPLAGQVLSWNAASTQWEPTTGAAGNVTSFATGTGLLGGPITTTGTINVDVGYAANKIVQENANAQIAQANGTVTLPTYAFNGSPATGLYSPGANQVAIVTGGTAALSVAASGFVGIGTASPQYPLDVSGVAFVGGPVNNLDQNQAGHADLTKLAFSGKMLFGYNYSGGAGETDFISNRQYGSSGGFQFYDYSNGNAVTPLMNITGAGQLGIGTLIPAAALDVAATGSASAIIVPRDIAGNRPTGVNGMLRYNTSNAKFEGFENGAWTNVISGAGTPAGSNGQLQFNGSGSFAADSALTYDPTNKKLQVYGNSPTLAAASPNYAAGGTMLSLIGVGLTNGNTVSMEIGTSEYPGAATVMSYRPMATGSQSGLQISSFGSNPTLSVVNGNNYPNSGNVGVGAQSTILAGLDVQTPMIAAGGVSYGVRAAQSLQAQANNDVLNAMYVDPTFNDNSYGPVAHNALIVTKGLVGFGTQAPQAALDVVNTGSASAMIIPRDIAGNRPAGVNGMLRYNTSADKFEAYEAGAWTNVIGGGAAGTPGQLASDNTGIGFSALQGVTGTSNSAFGSRALTSTTSGYDNVGIGRNALVNLTTSGGNVALGRDAGQALTTGANNVVIGYGAGNTNLATGSNNILIGAPGGYGTVDTPAAATSNFLNIGNLIFATGVTGSLSSPAGNVGIGTAAPAAGLDIALTGSASSAIIVPRDTAANRPAPVNGMIRYNTDAQAMEAYVNGTWVQFAMQATGSVQPVSASGPPVGANVFAISSASANYTPGFGSVANTYNGTWLAQGSNAYQNPSCVELDTQAISTNAIVYDLGSVRTINKIYLSGEGSAYSYMAPALAFSTDNVNFTSSFTTYLANTQDVEYSALTLSPNVTARYVRLMNGGGNTGTAAGDRGRMVFCQIAFGP